MNAEDEFGISLPDHAMHAVLPLVRAGGKTALRVRDDLKEYLWSRVKALAAQQSYGVSPEQITRETRFVEDLGYG